MAVSSANSASPVSLAFGISVIYRLNRQGNRASPWGRPSHRTQCFIFIAQVLVKEYFFNLRVRYELKNGIYGQMSNQKKLYVQ